MLTKLESLRIIVAMLNGERPTVAGEHYRVDDAINSPAPLSRIPVMIGGNGERKTLAEWAASVGLPQGLVAGRVAAGWPLDQALMMPKRDAEGGLEQAEVAVAAKGRRS